MLLEKIGDNGPMCGDNDICKSNETYKRDLHDLWRETYTEDQWNSKKTYKIDQQKKKIQLNPPNSWKDSISMDAFINQTHTGTVVMSMYEWLPWLSHAISF